MDKESFMKLAKEFEFIDRYHKSRSVLEILADRKVIINSNLYETVRKMAREADNAYETGDTDEILHYEGLVKSITRFCNSFKPKIEKTPFTFIEYLSARLGGMRRDEIKTDEEIKQHYDFSNINNRTFAGFNASYVRHHQK